jgi:hypothetical protein
MDITALQSQNFIEILSHCVPLIGWPTLVIGAWKARGWINSAEENFALRMDKITDNHLSHIQSAMESNADAMREIVLELRELRADIRAK